ncbi:unnamed protein product [Nyctereutes procyonoides]|uniref:(raccoon dog) hypothetical protein n=1 Tax=Nyctereutes procyonoides TaxID=34880 RepID=A0A811ZEI7_NYCPR|nr:unnamed protein product [Nyctereutes procyonoides]
MLSPPPAPQGATEIGTEISCKISRAIKGKLQDILLMKNLLIALLVMVANRKNQDQMMGRKHDLDKLCSSSDSNIFDNIMSSNKSSFSQGEERRHEAAVPPLAIASTRPEKQQTREDEAATRLMSTEKPLRSHSPLKIPHFCAGESLISEKKKKKKTRVELAYGSSCPSIETYQPAASPNADSGAHLNRCNLSSSSIHAVKPPDKQNRQVHETGRLCEMRAFNIFEKTWSPFFRNNSEKNDSIVKVKNFNHGGDEEEEDDDCGSHTGSISSSVSVPAKPGRRSSLPPSKPADKHLIVKAISEVQESGQSRTPRISPSIKEEQTKGDNIKKGQGTTITMTRDPWSMRHKIILKKPKLSEETIVAPNQEPRMKTADTPRGLSGHLMQMRSCKTCNPAGYMADQEEDMGFEGLKPVNQSTPACKNGDECACHHPVSPCKASPDCKFAEKKNLQYQHHPLVVNCDFPTFRKMERPFYHPKHCRSTGPDCTFYHPTITGPLQHALYGFNLTPE